MTDKIRGSMFLPMTSLGNVEDTFAEAKRNGVNTARVMLCYSGPTGSEEWPLVPFLKAGIWNPYALAGQPGYPDVPIYDLTKRNESFYGQLRYVVRAAKANGITLWLVFEDRCSMATEGLERFYNPFYSNIQRYQGWNTPGYYTPSTGVEPSIPGGTIGVGLDDYRYAYELAVIDLCYQEGVTVVYGEPCNEFGDPPSPDDPKDVQDQYIWDQVDWIARRCSALKNLKYSKVIISIRPPITEGRVYGVVDADYIDRHNIMNVSDVTPSPWHVGSQIWNTDGALTQGQSETQASVFGVKDPTPEQMTLLGEDAVRVGAAGVTYLSQSQIWARDAEWDMRDIYWEPQMALDKALGWKEEPPEAPVEFVTLTMCNANPFQYIANEYCPATNPVTFVKGTEPTTVCTIHKKEENKVDKLKEIWNWLFGPNSWWTKYPHLMGFLLGFLAGVLTVWVL